MAKNLDISIIIPVYNSEKYLRRCVDSVLKALNKTSGEILLINNNSTDDSPKIIKQYAKKYPNLIFPLECKIQGLSAVRNLGAKKARGKYLWFVDSDDEISPDSICQLLAKAKQSHRPPLDLIMFGATRIYQDGHTDYLSAIDTKSKSYKSRFVRYGMGAWQVLIRREWWQNNHFAFKEGIIHEDMEIMSSLILYTENVADINKSFYLYYQNEGSILHQNKFNHHIFDIFPALTGLYQRFKNKGADKTYFAELEWFFIWNLLVDSAKDFSKFKEGKPGFKRSRETLKQYFPHWRRNKFLRQKSIKLQIKVRINYYK